MSGDMCDLQQQQLLAVMLKKKTNLVSSSSAVYYIFFTCYVAARVLASVCVQPFLPQACANLVRPRGHEAGRAEVKVPISPEPGSLSHRFHQNRGKSAGQRRTEW